MTGYVSTRYYRAPEIMLTGRSTTLQVCSSRQCDGASQANPTRSGHLEHGLHFRRDARGQATLPGKDRELWLCAPTTAKDRQTDPRYRRQPVFHHHRAPRHTPDDVIQTIASENVGGTDDRNWAPHADHVPRLSASSRACRSVRRFPSLPSSPARTPVSGTCGLSSGLRADAHFSARPLGEDAGV
jgi:hypothetical protein